MVFVILVFFIAFTMKIYLFSVSKHCDIFLWAELRWRQKDPPDRFTYASYEVC